MAAPITSDLFQAKTITDDEVNAAIDVFMRDATVPMFRFASRPTIDPAVAVKDHEPSRKAIAEPGASETFRRGMVRTAILLARPTAP